MTTMMLRLCGLSAGLTPALNQQTHEEARFIRQLMCAWLHTAETQASGKLSTCAYKNQKQNKPEPRRRKQTKGKLGGQFMVVKLFKRFFCFKLLPLWARFCLKIIDFDEIIKLLIKI